MILLDQSEFVTTYTVPFLIGLAMPGRRSLIAAGVAGLAFGTFLSVLSDGDWKAAIVLLFVWIAIGGLCSGLLVRAATLWIAPLTRRPFRFMAIAILGYILPLIIVSGPSEVMAWLRRPSEQVCAAATYRVVAANMTLQVRATPLFAIGVLEAAGPSRLRHLSFGTKRDLIELCERALRDHQVIYPAAVSLDPWGFGISEVKDWAKTACVHPSDVTVGLICRFADKKPPREWGLERATVYGAEMDGVILVDGNYEVETQLHRRFRDSSEAFLLICEENASPVAGVAQLCAGQEVAANGLRIKFLYRTTSARKTADSDAIRAYLRELVASFIPEGSSSHP